MNEEKIYFYLDKNRLPKGPVSVEELKQLSTISDVVYCHAGDSEWKKFETNPPSGTTHTEKNLPAPSRQELPAAQTVASPALQVGSTISPKGTEDKPAKSTSALKIIFIIVMSLFVVWNLYKMIQYSR